jgi:glutamate--glyoxylate aminotransferase
MCILCSQAGRRSAKALHRLATSFGRSGTLKVAGEDAAYGVRAYAAAAQPAAAERSTTPNRIDGYVLHPSTMNPNILKAQYAVRGELYNKAQEMAAQGKEIIYTNGRW